MVSADRRALLFLVLYVAMLALCPLLLDEALFMWAFSETGPFERLSVWTWVVTALVVLWRIRPLTLRAYAFAAMCLAFAAREADWHKAFTGDSFLKFNFYRDAARPLQEKLICGAIATVLVALVLYVALVFARFLFLRGGWRSRSRSGGWLLAAGTLLVAGKLLDRLPAILSGDYGIEFSPLAIQYFSAFEEGTEPINPLIFAASVWISQTGRRYLS